MHRGGVRAVVRCETGAAFRTIEYTEWMQVGADGILGRHVVTDDQNPPEDPIGSDLVRDDPSFVDIVVGFVEGLGDRVTTMQNALQGNDFDALRTAAHQLKGSGGGYGYPVLTEEARKLEQLAKGQMLDECTNKLEELRQICERVVVGDDE